MPNAATVAKLRENLRVYEDAIATFERARKTMQARRRGASDSVMVHLDQSLKLNERTLASLQRVLDTAKEELRREMARDA
jgi:hypothetical protein